MMKQQVTKRLPADKSGSTRLNHECSVIATLKLFATKWKPCILCYLAEKSMRYTELYRIIPTISKKMLSEHLKELEINALIVRVQHDEKRQRVEYSLSDKGKSLLPILDQLQNWGLKNIKNVFSIQSMIAATMPQDLSKPV